MVQCDVCVCDVCAAAPVVKFSMCELKHKTAIKLLWTFNKDQTEMNQNK